MGRHTIAPSSLRSPAVVLGVPVAAVVATLGGNAVLGGVLPSAEQMPLRAESAAPVPADAPVGALPGPRPEILPGPPSWPSFPTLSPSRPSPRVTDGVVDGAAPVRAVDGGRDRAADGGRDRTADAAAGTIRVVRVAGASSVPPATLPDRSRVVHESVGRPAEHTDDVHSGGDDVPRPVIGDEGDRRAVAAAAPEPVPVVAVVPAPARTGLATERADHSVAASAYGEDLVGPDVGPDAGPDGDGGALVELDTPVGALSVLSFG